MEAAKPPRALILLGDWANIVAGITLTISFSVLCAALTFNAVKLAGQAHDVMQYTMIIEGVGWAVGGAALAAVNVIANNAALAVQQTIICFGGVFFTISGVGDGAPGKIISLPYVIPMSDPAHAQVQDAAPYWGISCFMFATFLGLKGVWVLPKNRLVSPFWGVASFFLGAWTIGLFALWGPCLSDGTIRYSDLQDGEQYSLPPFAWSWIHIFQVIGALFLTLGGVIFGIMDGIFGASSSGFEDNSEDESDSDIEN